MAIRRYTGGALPVAQVNTITVANTWATGDTATVTINGRDLVLTVGTDTTTAQVATAIKQMLNGDAQTGTGDHAFSETGDNVAEFQEVSATVNSSTVTVTAVTKGVPFTMTVTESTTGSGTATGATTTAATGPNHYDNADNWSGATLPVDGDTVIVEGDVDVLYGATQSAVTPAVLKFINFTGRFGLPDVNESGGYREYRTKFLAYGASGDATNMAVTVDCESPRIRLNGGDGQMTINVVSTGQPTDTQNAFEFKGTHASNAVNIVSGSVGLGAEPDDATTVIAALKLSGANAVAWVGSGVTLAAVDKQDGVLTVNCAITSSVINWSGDLTIDGAGAATGLIVYGGTLFYNTIGTLGGNPVVTAPGAIDFSQDARTKTVTNPIEVYGDAVVNDPKKVVSALVLDINYGANTANLNIGQNIRITRGTPA